MSNCNFLVWFLVSSICAGVVYAVTPMLPPLSQEQVRQITTAIEDGTVDAIIEELGANGTIFTDSNPFPKIFTLSDQQEATFSDCFGAPTTSSGRRRKRQISEGLRTVSTSCIGTTREVDFIIDSRGKRVMLLESVPMTDTCIASSGSTGCTGGVCGSAEFLVDSVAYIMSTKIPPPSTLTITQLNVQHCTCLN